MSHPDPLFDPEEVYEMDGVECGREDGYDDSDDAYDAAVDAYNMGFGPPVTYRQRMEEQEEADEFRRSGW